MFVGMEEFHVGLIGLFEGWQRDLEGLCLIEDLEVIRWFFFRGGESASRA